MLKSVLSAYELNEKDCWIENFGSGLINNTWKIKCDDKQYILQRINTNVFKKPFDIANNIGLISTYFKQNEPEYFFVSPISTSTGTGLYVNEKNEFFRLMPFVKNSHTIDVVATTSQAYEAAKQFGKFSALLEGFDVKKLCATIPDFHNLSLRYEQFEEALKNGNVSRIDESKELIEFLQSHKAIVDKYEKIKKNRCFKIRVTHHDTKISNVLFNDEDKGLCVIDLDTVMPGYFISDLGDMFRTYLSPVSEEEKDFSKIKIREDYFEAIVNGYLSEMNNALSIEELEHILYAGKFMIYMQALRFLTDYLNNDIYYGAKYERHNLFRANNQIILLQKLFEKEPELNDIVNNCIRTS